jgi:hypothetical protein
MPNTFEMLAGFLDRAEAEVEGRALEEPPETVKAKLRDFARGALPEAEKSEIIGHLGQNRHWILFLADEVKSLRNPSGDHTR